MNDREFIQYCRTHSETERALFNGQQIKRLARLAGVSDESYAFTLSDDEWRSIDLTAWCDKTGLK